MLVLQKLAQLVLLPLSSQAGRSLDKNSRRLGRECDIYRERIRLGYQPSLLPQIGWSLPDPLLLWFNSAKRWSVCSSDEQLGGSSGVIHYQPESKASWGNLLVTPSGRRWDFISDGVYQDRLEGLEDGKKRDSSYRPEHSLKQGCPWMQVKVILGFAKFYQGGSEMGVYLENKNVLYSCFCRYMAQHIHLQSGETRNGIQLGAKQNRIHSFQNWSLL